MVSKKIPTIKIPTIIIPSVQNPFGPLSKSLQFVEQTHLKYLETQLKSLQTQSLQSQLKVQNPYDLSQKYFLKEVLDFDEMLKWNLLQDWYVVHDLVRWHDVNFKNWNQIQINLGPTFAS